MTKQYEYEVHFTMPAFVTVEAATEEEAIKKAMIGVEREYPASTVTQVECVGECDAEVTS